MNEFLAQFLVESRDLVEQATEGLLVLERVPADSERLDTVFRAFHTLKGGAGIVEFTSMEQAVHAAEELLSDARAKKRTLTSALVEDCLYCLDVVVQWLDSLEASGDFPKDSKATADQLIERLRSSSPASAEGTGSTEVFDLPWIQNLLARKPVNAYMVTAIRYTPDSGCFFKGEDPVARVTSLPGLLAFHIEVLGTPEPLNDFDPYYCNLALTALTTVSPAAVNTHMHGHSGTCDIQSITARGALDDDSSLPLRARELLRAQIVLIENASLHNFAGLVGSAGRSAASVLRFCGHDVLAELLAGATQQSLSSKTSQPLRMAIEQALALPTAVEQATAPTATPHLAKRTLRVEAARIDALVRLTGELTVAKNAAGHMLKLAQLEDNTLTSALKEHHSVVEHLVSELQRAVLGIRVLPLRTVLQRFPRVLRDMSSMLGKPTTLHIEGDETEADKAVVEMLFEPLLHVLRNALDHGIETSALRKIRGKPDVARVAIHASRCGDQVLIDVSDDGSGIDLDLIRATASRRGVVSEKVLSAMSESDLIDLVFAPGFSTAASVTELSGRGVGMDAVRTAVEKVGGRVNIESRSGLGTSVRFALPFSVMMTYVVIVEAAGQLFGVPLDTVIEIVRVPTKDIGNIGTAQAIVIRNRTLPVLDLASVLGKTEESVSRAEATLVIVASAGQFTALRVDRIGERMQVILKPLEGLLVDTPGFTGTTLLGDGRVLLVLNIAELLS